MIIFVMKIVRMVSSQISIIAKYLFDGTPYAMKVACTVWARGKDRDNFKVLPISIIIQNNPLSIDTLVEVTD